jgi:hypothetical protein
MECYLSVVITFFHFTLKTLHRFKNRQMFLGKRKASWDPNTPEPHRPQHDRPATCVIAQQYYPATFVSLRFQFKEEMCVHFKNVIASTSFTFLKKSQISHLETAWVGGTCKRTQLSSHTICLRHRNSFHHNAASRTVNYRCCTANAQLQNSKSVIPVTPYRITVI